jgi:hypothetical protein
MTKPSATLIVLAAEAFVLMAFAVWAICCAAGLGERARGKK